jgi:hypothetical protein
MKTKTTSPRPVAVTPEQENIIRHFLVGAENLNIKLSAQLVTELYNLLGYKVAPNGARVNKNKELKAVFGQPFNPRDEFYDDWQEITDAEIKDQSKSSTSESP